MTKGVINLRQARKAKARAEARAAGDANAARHGATKSERMMVSAETDRAARALDAQKIEEDE
ncbi:MAG: DUF4169 family protein [Paracoccaceae bacterium]